MSTTQSRQPARLYSQSFVDWQRKGLSARAGRRLVLAGCDTIEQIASLGQLYFERLPNGQTGRWQR